MARALGGEAQNGFESSESGVAEHRSMVSAPSPPAARRTTANPGSEVTWSLRVLRHHRQQQCAVDVPYCGRALLAVLAESPEPRAVARLGSLQSPAGAVSAPADEGGPLGVRSRSEPMIGGTVCIKDARTGLWEPRVGNCPGPPGHATFPRTSSVSRFLPLAVHSPGTSASASSGEVYSTTRPGRIGHYKQRPA